MVMLSQRDWRGHPALGTLWTVPTMCVYLSLEFSLLSSVSRPFPSRTCSLHLRSISFTSTCVSQNLELVGSFLTWVSTTKAGVLSSLWPRGSPCVLACKRAPFGPALSSGSLRSLRPYPQPVPAVPFPGDRATGSPCILSRSPRRPHGCRAHCWGSVVTFGEHTALLCFPNAAAYCKTQVLFPKPLFWE